MSELDFKSMENKLEKVLQNETKENVLAWLDKKRANLVSDRLDLQVNTTFTKEDIKKRYDRICQMIEQWHNRVQTEKDYAQGYEFGLVAAEKCFRNLFKEKKTKWKKKY